ncbi:MAG: hypothetical protein BGO01_21360 [Armatimonadetes bacterium 55-13]|nr:MAG: hypothetical protein BGO01_21360 [Armatimonadetes bacterium 55-13]
MTVPPITNPSFELPPIEPPRPIEDRPRNPLGWIVLGVLLFLIFASQLASYLTRDQTPEGKYLDAYTKLQVAVRLKDGVKSTLGTDDGGATLSKIADDVKADAEKNATAARIYSAALSEQGKVIPEKVIATLKESAEKRDQTFAEVFSAKEITPARAKEIEQKLKGGGFISQLATVQAYEKAGDKTKRKSLDQGIPFEVRMAILAMVSLAFMLGIFLWIGYIVLRTRGLFQPLGFPLARISLIDSDRLALRCAQIFCIFVVAPIGIAVLGAPLKSLGTTGQNLVSLVTYASIICGTLLLFRTKLFGKRFTLKDIGISLDANLPKHVLWGLCTACANLPLVVIASLIGQKVFSWLPNAEHPVTVQLQTQNDWFTTLTLILVASVGAPIIEEIMFRGTLLPALNGLLGKPWLAIVLQGFIFAIIHPTGVPAWLPLATIGAMSGVLTRQTGSLVPSIAMHAFHNFGTLLMAKAALGFLGF